MNETASGTADDIQLRENQVLTLEMVLQDLVADGLLDKEQATEMRVTNQHRRGPRIHPLVLVGNQNYRARREPHEPLTLDYLTHWLAERHGLDYYRIDPLKVDVPEVTAAVSYAYAHKRNILPVRIDPERAVFATAEPYQFDWQEELQPVLKREVARVIANPLDIVRYLDEFYNLSRSMKGASAEHDHAPSGITNLEQLVALGREGKLDANDRHVVSIVDWLLQYAFDQRASDIHIEPRREQGHIRFRIDGVLHSVYEMPVTVMVAVTSRLKALARMDVVEKRRPQDGRIKTKTPSGGEIELRLSTMPTAFGEKMVLRIFDPEVLVRSFADLGFAKADRERWLGQDHDPLLDAEAAGAAGDQRLLGRGPDRDGRGQLQPDAGADRDRRHLRQRHPHAAAPGSGHHHGRRDPRPRDRGDGDPGRLDRAPGAVDAAHQ
jgi:general secretion pathway protein E